MSSLRERCEFPKAWHREVVKLRDRLASRDRAPWKERFRSWEKGFWKDLDAFRDEFLQ